MDSPARAPRGRSNATSATRATRVAPTLDALAIDSDDDLDDDDYRPGPALGSLDWEFDDESASEDGSSGDESDEIDDDDDDDGARALARPVREYLEDTESDGDVSLEDEDFDVAAEAASDGDAESPRRGMGAMQMMRFGGADGARAAQWAPGGGRRRRGGAANAALASVFDDDSRGAASLGNSPAKRAAGAAVDLGFDGFFDDDDDEEMLLNAIARRTRAKTGTIEERELAELELALPDAEPEYDWLDDGAEYDRFLATLNDASVGFGDLQKQSASGRGTNANDDEDEDDEDDDDYADENPRVAAYEYILRRERLDAIRRGDTSAPPSIVRRSDRISEPSGRTGDGKTLREKRKRSRKLLQKNHKLIEQASSMTSAQFKTLAKQIHQHTQLLFQTYSICATREDLVEVTSATLVNITILQRAGVLQDRRLRDVNRKRHAKSLYGGDDAPWHVCAEKRGVQTVLDCAPLRCAFNFVHAMSRLAFAPPPRLWRDPVQMFEITHDATSNAAFAPNSEEHVRVDDLFRPHAKTWTEVMDMYDKLEADKYIQDPVTKRITPVRLGRNRAEIERGLYVWQPVPREVFELTKRFLPEISPDPSLLIGAAPLSPLVRHKLKSRSKHDIFTPAEEWLIVLGIRRYSSDWRTIATQLLVNAKPTNIRERANQLRKAQKYENTEIGIAARREYDHATRALDENEISIIERALSEVEWKSANARDLAKYDRKLWDFVCSRLKDRVPFAVHKRWRDHENAISGRKSQGVNRGPKPAATARGKRKNTITREEIADSASDSDADDVPLRRRFGMERDDLSGSESEDDPVVRNPFTQVQDSALIACAAFNEPFESLLKPGAACEGRSLDAILIRYNQLKAMRA